MTRLQIVGAVVAIAAGLATVGGNFDRIRSLFVRTSPDLDYTYERYDPNGIACLLSKSGSHPERFYRNDAFCHLGSGRLFAAWFVHVKNNGAVPINRMSFNGKAWSGLIGHLSVGESAMLCAISQPMGQFNAPDPGIDLIQVVAANGKQVTIKGRPQPSSSAMGEASGTCPHSEGYVPGS